MDKYFRLNIPTVDTIDKDTAVRAQEIDPDYTRNLRNLVVVADSTHDYGQVWISTDIMAVLGLDTHYRNWGTFGRIRLFRWAGEIHDMAIEHATYSRRSDRERFVQERNIELIAWLENLEAGK